MEERLKKIEDEIVELKKNSGKLQYPIDQGGKNVIHDTVKEFFLEELYENWGKMQYWMSFFELDTVATGGSAAQDLEGLILTSGATTNNFINVRQSFTSTDLATGSTEIQHRFSTAINITEAGATEPDEYEGYALIGRISTGYYHGFKFSRTGAGAHLIQGVVSAGGAETLITLIANEPLVWVGPLQLMLEYTPSKISFFINGDFVGAMNGTGSAAFQGVDFRIKTLENINKYMLIGFSQFTKAMKGIKQFKI